MERKLKKKPSNNKTRTMFKMQKSGLFSHDSPIEVEAEFPDMNYKGRPQNSLKASVPIFQPSISADYGTLTKPHICNRIKELEVVQCRTAITEAGFRMFSWEIYILQERNANQ